MATQDRESNTNMQPGSARGTSRAGESGDVGGARRADDGGPRIVKAGGTPGDSNREEVWPHVQSEPYDPKDDPVTSTRLSPGGLGTTATSEGVTRESLEQQARDGETNEQRQERERQEREGTSGTRQPRRSNPVQPMGTGNTAGLTPGATPQPTPAPRG